MGKMSDWQKEYLDRIEPMDIMELYAELLEQSYPDDHDGEFTNRGHWRFEQVKIMFKLRLESLQSIAASMASHFVLE